MTRVVTSARDPQHGGVASSKKVWSRDRRFYARRQHRRESGGRTECTSSLGLRVGRRRSHLRASRQRTKYERLDLAWSLRTCAHKTRSSSGFVSQLDGGFGRRRAQGGHQSERHLLYTYGDAALTTASPAFADNIFASTCRSTTSSSNARSPQYARTIVTHVHDHAHNVMKHTDAYT